MSTRFHRPAMGCAMAAALVAGLLGTQAVAQQTGTMLVEDAIARSKKTGRPILTILTTSST
jgi:hypothetical protein